MEITPMPDIAKLSTAMAQSEVMTKFSTELLATQLDTMQEATATMTQMMELSVNPSIGTSIDISL
ncbi:MAG: YjfB family protein [Lachnospira sp.]|nr:YjfB family protein [Lachnospira sp.]